MSKVHIFLFTNQTLEIDLYISNFYNTLLIASNDAHVILSTKAEASAPFIEIFLGGWENSKSAIRLNNEKPNKCEGELT